MDGGDGDDTYYVDNTGDTVSETVGAPLGGVDLAFSSVNFTLSAGIENLTLIGLGNVNGTGNSGENVIKGESHDNILSGLGGSDSLFGYVGEDVLNGGTGADFMDGGDQNDTYIVDNIGDTANEQFGTRKPASTSLCERQPHPQREPRTSDADGNQQHQRNRQRQGQLADRQRQGQYPQRARRQRQVARRRRHRHSARRRRHRHPPWSAQRRHALGRPLGRHPRRRTRQRQVRLRRRDRLDPGARDSVQAGDGAIAFEGPGAVRAIASTSRTSTRTPC